MGRGGEGRGGEGANKVLQPAQSVRLRASIRFHGIHTNCHLSLSYDAPSCMSIMFMFFDNIVNINYPSVYY